MKVEFKENKDLRLDLLVSLFSGKEPNIDKIKNEAGKTGHVSVEYAIWAPSPFLENTSTDLLIKLQVGDYRYCMHKRFGICDGGTQDAILSLTNAVSYLTNLQKTLETI